MFEIQILDKNLGILDTESNPKNFIVNSFNQKINSIGEARISIFYESSLAKREILKKGRKINIFLSGKIVFSGIIKGFTAGIEKIDLVLNDYFYLLSRRLLRIEKTYTNLAIKDIVQDLIDYINGIDNTQIILNCDILDLYTKTFTRGTSFYQILQDISKSGYKYKLENNILYLSKDFGQDLSSDIYYIYNINEPYGQNIDKINLTEDIKDFSNSIIDKTGELEDLTSKNDIGLFENKESNEVDKIEYLNDHLVIGDYKITPRVKSYFEASIGDKVGVDIISNNDILYYSGIMEVAEKRFTNGDLQKIDFTLSISGIKIKDFLDDYLDLKNRISKLEII